jgi:hypothetical protein
MVSVCKKLCHESANIRLLEVAKSYAYDGDAEAQKATSSPMLLSCVLRAKEAVTNYVSSFLPGIRFECLQVLAGTVTVRQG